MGGMHFGGFITDLLRRKGLTVPQFAEMIRRSPQAVYKWVDRKSPPRSESMITAANALRIPPEVFMDAATGKAKLPEAYYKARDDDRREQVWAWFTSAPPPVQQAILNTVPEGMEADYLRHVTEYFRAHLAPKGKSRRAG